MKEQKKAVVTQTDGGKKPLIIGLVVLGVLCAFAFGILAGQKMSKPKAEAPASAATPANPAGLEAIKTAILEAQARQLENAVGQVKEMVFSDKLSLDAGLPVSLFDLSGVSPGRMKGPANAAITLVEFTDFQCPFCARMANALDQVMAKHPGQIRLIVVDRPLIVERNGFPFHPYAMIAHEAAAAAEAQGKFWEMYDYIFKNQQELFPGQPSSPDDYIAKQAQFREKLTTVAGTLGLDAAKFKADLESHAQKAIIDRSLAVANALNINSTPTLMTAGYFRLNNPELVSRLLNGVQKIQ